MPRDARRTPRHRVALSVRFHNARDFVTQYAQNLSAGGLYLPGANSLEVRAEVELELELPGHGKFTLTAEVVHRDAHGAGFQLTKLPPAFTEATRAYLLQLGRRTSITVYVDVEPWRGLVTAAGYRVFPVPPLPALLATLEDTDRFGVVVPQELARPYADEIAILGAQHATVIPVHPKLPVDPVLKWLDDTLLAD
ncbi:MAG: PilZ domain-containing protein [Kofleriaceae bacterium]|nr:PilZ domain-containing protein [Kofleriaceae bacterium]